MRRPLWIVLLSVVLTAISAHFAVKLYRNLRTDFEELLPTQSRSVRDLNLVQDRMESTESLAVLVFSDHPEQSKRFITDLATAVDTELPGLVSHVEYRIDDAIRFFERRRALMMDLPDLTRIRDYIEDRFEYEEKIRNPLNIFSGETIMPPELNWLGLTTKYSGRVSDFTRFRDGFYATPDGRIRVALVYMTGQVLGVSQALKLRAGVDQIVARLQPSRYAPDIQVKYTGDVQNLLEERASVIKDLELSTVLVTLLVVVAMIAYFRDLAGTAALVLSLFAGTICTFGISYFAVGYLNANSAFLGSIVLGNGINFGIVLLARYLEERARMPHAEAQRIAIRGAMGGTLTAALAAALSYGSLGFTTFRGFRQFGYIGLIGMALCWISAFTLMPALLTLFDRFRRASPRPAASRRGYAWLAAGATTRLPMLVLGAGLCLTLVLGAFAARNRGPLLETDTSKLRDRRSMEKGSGYLTHYLDEIFGRYLSPLVILPHTRAQTRRIEASLKRLQARQGPASLIAHVYSIDDFVPRDQEQKILVLEEIRYKLKPKYLALLAPRERKIVNGLLTPEAFKPFTIKELPPLIRARFREKDGSVGLPVLAEPVFNEEITNLFSNQKTLIDEIRATADAVDPRAAVVGQLALTVDMIASISHDGPLATAVALGAVILLLVVLFRSPAAILQSLFALLLGVVWMACAARAAAIKINFLNFIALPITFGIGVDYGVNLLVRIRHEGAQRVGRSVATTGGAVALASLTTIIGYSSLLIAGNQGFVSFGRLAVLGELTTQTAAIWMLPALLLVLDRRARARGARKPPQAPVEHEAPRAA